MFTKIAIIFSLAVAASAIAPGYVSAPYALGSQAEHTVRGYGGLSSFSKQAKAVDSPYSTVRKTDIRVTNDAAYAPAAAVTYAHPGHYATPAFAHHGVPHYPGGYHVPAGAITYAHRGYAAPHTVAHAPIGYHHGAIGGPAHVSHAPIGYHGATIAAPAVQKQVHAVPVSHHGLGVAYSPATAVATATFSGYGVHYGY